MVEVLQAAMARSDVVIITGGLGPTVDDVTRPAVARATGRELEFHPELFEQIAARFRGFGVPMSENNRRQAYVPRGAIVVENPVGTAPSFIVEHERGIVISLPGVPSEMEYLLTRAIVPYLRKKLDLREVILTRTLHAVSLGESRIDAAIADLQTGQQSDGGAFRASRPDGHSHRGQSGERRRSARAHRAGRGRNTRAAQALCLLRRR